LLPSPELHDTKQGIKDKIKIEIIVLKKFTAVFISKLLFKKIVSIQPSGISIQILIYIAIFYFLCLLMADS